MRGMHAGHDNVARHIAGYTGGYKAKPLKRIPDKTVVCPECHAPVGIRCTGVGADGIRRQQTNAHRSRERMAAKVYWAARENTEG